jgi:hypothetical protein
VTDFLITPHEPTGRQQGSSDLRIDPATYKEQMLENWPEAQFADTFSKALQWILYTVSERGTLVPHGIGSLHADLQTVIVDTPYERFFLWHRQFVSCHHRLFLYNTGTSEWIELTPDIALEDIEAFCGRRSRLGASR